MISKVISVLVLAALLHSSIAAQAASSPAQSVANMQQVLRKAQDKAKAVTVTLNRKADKKAKLTGKVSDVSNTSFTITDRHTGNRMTLAYEDVQQVKQKGMSRGAKVAIGIGIGVGAFIAVGVIVCYASGPCRD
jgi:Skp family chaperone for outer membrane proteins